MTNNRELVSPKQVASALGVSESSLKRWCDQGLLSVVRTAGGHRKMAIGEVLRFARERGYPIVSPAVIGLPVISPGSSIAITRAADKLAESLLAGDEAQSRQIVVELYLAKNSLSVIFDDVLAKAFQIIGNQWECGAADVYHERRACSIATWILLELRRLQPVKTSRRLAIGGTIEGDVYSLPTMMAEMVLCESNWNAMSLGNGIPFESLIRAVQDLKPRLFWLSVSHIRTDIDFAAEFAKLSQVCRNLGTAIVVGGRALNDELRRQMTYTAYCDTMQQFETLAESLERTGGSRNAGAFHEPSVGATTRKRSAKKVRR